MHYVLCTKKYILYYYGLYYVLWITLHSGVCMYVCMHARMRACMHVRIRRIKISRFVFTFAFLYVCGGNP